MILGPVSYLDCFVFLLFLAPQLLINAGLWNTLTCVLEALPFLLLELPFSVIYERYVKIPSDQTPFVQQSSAFEDAVIRCVRYAFASIPASICCVFFSKPVALPFMKFRMLRLLARHGYLRSPIPWQEISKGNMKGIWMIHDPKAKPDLIVYYAHGGGFAMGSPYFYLEFLLTLLGHLKTSTFTNPAIFALAYTLVPDAHYPTQIHQALAGYKYILSLIDNDPSKVCVAGDSAGATIMLSLLLLLSQQDQNPNSGQDKSNHPRSIKLGKPALAALISPWTTLHSPIHINATQDYLNAARLHYYGSLYISTSPPIYFSPVKPLDTTPRTFASPGLFPPRAWSPTLTNIITDNSSPTNASPTSGFLISYSPAEFFGPSIRAFISTLHASGTTVRTIEGKGKGEGIHAWVVASLFLCRKREERIEGVKKLGEGIVEMMAAATGTGGEE